MLSNVKGTSITVNVLKYMPFISLFRLEKGREGVIHDGTGNYSKRMSCSWLLEADEPGMSISMNMNNFATECIWDHLYIYNGNSTFSPLVAVYRYAIPRLYYKMKPYVTKYL